MAKPFHHIWISVLGITGTFCHVSTGDVLNPSPGQTPLSFVTVGDAGNAADTRYPQISYGAVPYQYQMGKYEVTMAQYAEFLNAVARNGDPYSLVPYYPYNFTPVEPIIQAHSSGGQFSYSVPAGTGNMPMGNMNWLALPASPIG